MARAWTWPFSSAASVSLTSRWRSTRDLPANSGDITRTRKWLSPVPGELWWPACTCDSLITSSRVGRSAIISFSRIVAAIDIQEAVLSEKHIRTYWSYTGAQHRLAVRAEGDQHVTCLLAEATHPYHTGCNRKKPG